MFPSMTLYACPGSCLFPLLLIILFVWAISLAIGRSIYRSNPKHVAMLTAAMTRSPSVNVVGRSMMSSISAMERDGVRRM
jgi:hypothetical protein